LGNELASWLAIQLEKWLVNELVSWCRGCCGEFEEALYHGVGSPFGAESS